ncbi:UDP-glycosyltransferase UGT5-like [Diabrotica virgifera virgifera]|uniref:UDP-glucuronosyltransferase n=1 Tax=Diabrotica virgifera virgifera TaxID=50390 RepID=A0ABM5JV02_DIAVI|nr:UDP-glycosyltransferase UGT5-like [Diabrotica virgifera virgifera]XP_050501767.1 UDP-glycosyltransferase UGT5-like [Diabrotica virgifera virgifera]XP_050501768.1 UDP-glycosyltransferase UGT5-like [Diabrotica virgifera virgifera]
MKAVILILFTLICTVHNYNVLIISPMVSSSHFYLGNALGRGLVEAGHQVTVVSPYEDKNPLKGYKDVVLTGLAQQKRDISPLDFYHMDPFSISSHFADVGTGIVNNIFNHPNFKNLINSNEKFDVLIIQYFRSDALNILQCHYNAPLIVFSIVVPGFWVNPIVGSPLEPSYFPDFLLKYSSNMNFWERTVNSLLLLFNYVHKHLYFIPQQKKLMSEHFPKCTDQDAAFYNASLVFVTAHESANQPIPLVPSMINIGGHHIKPAKELPKDLKIFMDKAKEGVVYFSLGTNVDPTNMKPEQLRDILNSLGKIKQKVLWKYGGNVTNLPKNVQLGKWFPQSDLLAHPNLKLFITHGGLLSTLETVYHGVPILALPVFADQNMNGAIAQEAGYGISLPFAEVTEEKLTNALHEVLTNPKYEETVKIRSSIFHDRPMKPLDLAVYWTEFVVRHKGAPHLRVGSMDLRWYQYLLLDVIAAVSVVIVIVFTVLYILCISLCCSKQKRKDKAE